MDKLTCIIVDDEPLAIEILEEYVKKVPQLDLLATMESGLEAIAFAKNNRVDLVFLDIQMPDITGIQTAELIDQHCRVIFTTAYNEYAVEGFEVEAVDYLLKPISFDRFVKAVQRMGTQARELPGEQPQDEFIFVKTEYRIKKIRFDEIRYIEGMKDYLRIVTKTEKVMTLLSFSKLIPRLPAKRFMRIHKSYVVALDAIEALEKSKVKIGDVFLPISDTYRKLLDEFIRKRLP